MSNEVLLHLNTTDFTGGDVVAGELELKNRYRYSGPWSQGAVSRV